MTDAANPTGLTDEEAQEFPVVGCWSSLRPQLGVDLASLVLTEPKQGGMYDEP
jgi:hypothetical protein